MLFKQKIISKIVALSVVFALFPIFLMSQGNQTISPDSLQQVAPDTTNMETDTPLVTLDTTIIQHSERTPPPKKPVDSASLLPVDSLAVFYFVKSFDNLKLNHVYPIDTSITYFQQYDQLTYQNKLYSTLSNIGLAAKNQVFSPSLPIGYSTDIETFKNYSLDNNQVKYLLQKQPFTEIFYIMGSKKEQNLQVTFSRDIIEDLTFGLHFELNNSPGPYKNNKSNDTRVYFTSQYQTKNKRYGILANYLHNKLEMQENGGISADSLFEQNLEPDRRVIPVYLENASNLVKKSGFYVEQYFNLLKPDSPLDSIHHKIDIGSLSYAFQYERNQSIYEDSDSLSGFYIGHLAPLDSTSTLDSVYQSNISNTIKWSSLGYYDNADDKHFHLYFGITHQYLRQSFAYDSVDRIYNQLIPIAGMGINIGRSFYLNVDAKLVTGEYNGGDYQINGTLRQFLGRKERNIGQFEASLQLINKTPDWYFNEYNSNYYRWKNDFKKEQYSILEAKYIYRQVKVGGKFHTIVNYTYFNDSMQPTQLNNGETVMQLYFEGSIPWKSVGINTRVVYQETSQPNVMRMPKLTGTADLYFQHSIFKSAATVKTGFQVTYFTDYYADAYMPELRVFYLQDKQKIGDYVYIDYYVTLVVKRARMFFKIAHLNGYLGDYRYYSAPNYPSRDARFYFGVNWRFHD